MNAVPAHLGNVLRHHRDYAEPQHTVTDLPVGETSRQLQQCDCKCGLCQGLTQEIAARSDVDQYMHSIIPFRADIASRILDRYDSVRYREDAPSEEQNVVIPPQSMPAGDLRPNARGEESCRTRIQRPDANIELLLRIGVVNIRVPTKEVHSCRAKRNNPGGKIVVHGRRLARSVNMFNVSDLLVQ